MLLLAGEKHAAAGRREACCCWQERSMLLLAGAKHAAAGGREALLLLAGTHRRGTACGCRRAPTPAPRSTTPPRPIQMGRYSLYTPAGKYTTPPPGLRLAALMAACSHGSGPHAFGACMRACMHAVVCMLACMLMSALMSAPSGICPNTQQPWRRCAVQHRLVCAVCIL